MRHMGEWNCGGHRLVSCTRNVLGGLHVETGLLQAGFAILTRVKQGTPEPHACGGVERKGVVLYGVQSLRSS